MPLRTCQRRRSVKGTVRLQVPFSSQFDGSLHADSNCAPAALAMALSAYGLDGDATTIRTRANIIDSTADPDDGVTLNVLGSIANEYGLTQIGSADWSLETVRQCVKNGHPVVMTAGYRWLTGHAECQDDGDHCILVTGTTPRGFIYNDPDYTTRDGRDVEITTDALELAWRAGGKPEALAFA